MAISPKGRDPLTGTTTTTRGDARRWILYVIGAILLLLVLLWLFGAFDRATDTATTPAPATTEEGTTAPAPAAPQ